MHFALVLTALLFEQHTGSPPVAIARMMGETLFAAPDAGCAVLRERLIEAEGRARNLDVSEASVDELRNQVREELHLSEAQFEQALRDDGRTPEVYRRQLRLWELGRRLVIAEFGDPEVTEAETVARSRELEAMAVEVRARHIVISVAPDARADEVALAWERALAVEARARAPGTDFAELARELSEGASRESAGDLGYFGRGQMTADFEAAVFALAPGEISAPVRSKFGFHVVKVEDRRTSPDDAGRRLSQAYDELLARRWKAARRRLAARLWSNAIASGRMTLIGDGPAGCVEGLEPAPDAGASAPASAEPKRFAETAPGTRASAQASPGGTPCFAVQMDPAPGASDHSFARSTAVAGPSAPARAAEARDEARSRLALLALSALAAIALIARWFRSSAARRPIRAPRPRS